MNNNYIAISKIRPFIYWKNLSSHS